MNERISERTVTDGEVRYQAEDQHLEGGTMTAERRQGGMSTAAMAAARSASDQVRRGAPRARAGGARVRRPGGRRAPPWNCQTRRNDESVRDRDRTPPPRTRRRRRRTSEPAAASRPHRWWGEAAPAATDDDSGRTTRRLTRRARRRARRRSPGCPVWQRPPETKRKRVRPRKPSAYVPPPGCRQATAAWSMRLFRSRLPRRSFDDENERPSGVDAGA